jgi:hypothetical protein
MLRSYVIEEKAAVRKSQPDPASFRSRRQHYEVIAAFATAKKVTYLPVHGHPFASDKRLEGFVSPLQIQFVCGDTGLEQVGESNSGQD